jgi:soluble lytic murein transglycosylase
MRPPTRDDLEVPAVSIRIGARYLGDLLGRFGGSIPLALASYNAGPGAVARWLAARGDLDVDEFVEEIPYEETRVYVKRVLRSFAAYRILYGAEPRAPVELRLAGRSEREPGLRTDRVPPQARTPQRRTPARAP